MVKKCSFHIFPSCSEGMPGAVITTMSLGIIPIVTKESGITCDNNEFVITHDIVNITNKIVDCSSCDLNELKLRSNNIIAYSRTLKNKFEKVINTTIEVLNST